MNLSQIKLLNEDNSFHIHQRNLQKLVTEIFRVKIGLTHQDVHEIVEFIEKLHSLQTISNFRSKRTHPTKYVMESPSYLDPKLWNLAPNEY